MLLNRVFDEVFRTWSNIAVMRALLDTTNGFSGNEVARVAGMHPRSAFKALTLLESLGIVNRKIGGRDHIFSLNRENFLFQEAIHKVFKVESNFRNAVIDNLNSILKGKVYGAVIFGSVARKEETLSSDLDLCCVVNQKSDKSIVEAALDAKSIMLNNRFGIKLAPVYFTKSEFINKKRTRLISDIANEGILITGKNLRGLLNGSKNPQKIRKPTKLSKIP